MNGLVKVPPYSKLNFQGKIFFTQNWCNITLNFIQPKTYNTADQSRFWYRCNIAHLPLNNNHSLTQWNICIRVNEACSVYTWYLQVKNESEKWPHRRLFEQVMNMIFYWIFHNSLNNEEEGSFYVIDYKEEHVIFLLFLFPFMYTLPCHSVTNLVKLFVNSWIITFQFVPFSSKFVFHDYLRYITIINGNLLPHN
jgi:hypothetical protein